MATNIKTIKDGIKTQLDALVTATTLGYASEADLRKNVLDNTIPAFPAAFLMPPATESEVIDNRTVMRTYTFDILIVMKADNLVSNADVENLLEVLLDRFDNLPTLSGAADGAVLPATSTPVPIQSLNVNYIAFTLTLKVNRTEGLTY